MYIIDEPSIGLQQRDNVKLIEALKNLRDLGNSVIVVEHDKEMMLLRRKLKKVEQERDFLKEAAAYFAKESK